MGQYLAALINLALAWENYLKDFPADDRILERSRYQYDRATMALIDEEPWIYGEWLEIHHAYERCTV
jgi:hypothetical protein